MDNIAKAYIQMRRLSEMTLPTISKGTFLTDEDVQQYKNNKHLLKFDKVGDYDVGSVWDNKQMIYVTFKNGEPIHYSELTTNRNGSRAIPFPHDYHTMVNQKRGNGGVARLVMHHHVDNSGQALVAGPLQSKHGHGMWCILWRRETFSYYGCF